MDNSDPLLYNNSNKGRKKQTLINQTNNNTMRKALTNIYYVIVALIMFDVMILMTSIAQLAYEGQTGYWSPFWRIQAEFFINLIS